MSILSKVKVVAFGLLGAVMFFAVGNNVLAMGTPDGETPAEETVCDELSGPSFGLCNAYCEAMDCDSDFPAASQNACDKVAANYAKHSDGEELPCVVVEEECPCLDLAPDILALNYTPAGCFGSGTPCPEFINQLSFSCGVELPFPPVSNQIFLNPQTGEAFCTTALGPNSTQFEGPLTEGEYATCAAQVNTFCNQ